MRPTAVLLACLLLSCLEWEAEAKNVDLVTLPARDSVQLTIYNSVDLTLVKETRFVTLKQGSNQLQFSWAGTLIDPTSVELRPLQNADAIDVVDTVFPGQKKQHLIWNVDSAVEGQVAMQVSYFTSGLTWRMDYTAIADPGEVSLDFRGYVRVFNNSGEEYENAEIRLIVGKINLVEKIAALAKSQGLRTAEELMGKKTELERLALGDVIAEAEGAANDRKGGQRRQIVKEGLSEYFMFSVEGEESIRNGWSKRMEAVRGHKVEFEIVYRMRDYQYGPRPVRFFVWRNDEEHKLGHSPLPNGEVRVFRQNGSEGLGFLGRQKLDYVPVKAEIEVNLGADDLVVLQRRRDQARRRNFSFHPVHQQVTGWDELQAWGDTVRNYRSQPIRLELRLRFGGDVEFAAPQATTSFDYNTVEANFEVAASGSTEYSYLTTTHHGSNAKQNRVRIVPK